MPQKQAKPGTINPNFTKLVNFLAEKSKNVTKPLSVIALSREFKEHSRSSESIDCLNSRIKMIRDKFHSIPNFDTDTKLKMMFALSAPLDYGFLHELKDRADVKLDDSRRIIEYETKGGGLKLKGEHVQTVQTSNERSKKMLTFLAEKAKERDTPMTDRQFSKEFISFIGGYGNIGACENRYRIIKNDIYETNEFDKETKTRMLFVSGTKLHQYALEELRKDAQVEVDECNRITMFKSKDQSLVLEGEQNVYAKRKLVHTEIWNKISQTSYDTDTDDGDDESDKENDCSGMSYQEEMADLIQFVANKCQSATSVLSIYNICKEYKSLSRSSTSLKSLECRITRYRQRIHSLENIDSNSKVKQMFALSASIDSEYLKELQKNATVELDDKKRIIKYEAKDGSLKLQGDHSRSAKNKIRWALSRKMKKNAVKRGDRRRLTKSKGGRAEQKKKTEAILGSEDSKDDESDESETGDDDDKASDGKEESEDNEDIGDDDDEESDENEDLEDVESEERNETDRRSERISRRMDISFDAGDYSDRQSPASILTRNRKRRVEEDDIETRIHKKRSSQIKSDSDEGEESGQELYEDEDDSELADEEVNRMMTSRQRRLSERRESISSQRMDDSMEREYPIDDYEMENRNDDYNGMESFNTHDNEYHSKEDQGDTSERMKESIDIQSSEEIHSDDSEKKEDEDSNRIHENQKNQEQNGNSFISIETHLKFLESIQTIVSDYNDPSFNSIQLRIRQKIEKIKESGNNEEKVTINEIRMILNTILSIVTKNAVIQSINNHESSTNLVQFLLIFRIFVISIQIPILDPFQTKIRALILDPSNQNKRFPTENVRLAVDIAMKVVAPLID